jgi:integrase
MAINEGSSSPSDFPQPSQVRPETPLQQAAEIILNQKLSRHLRPKTIESSKGQIKALLSYFGDIPLKEITPGAFVAYQAHRSKTACADTVNHECALLKKMLKKAPLLVDGIRVTLWDSISEYYNPLTPKEWKPPKTFTVAEQCRIFETTKDDSDLELAHIVFRISRNTTACGSELRNLKLGNLELDAHPPRINVPRDGTKNDVRPRTIPLNEEALAAFQAALSRAAKLGSYRYYHYLFPFRVNRALWNPLKPASTSWLRKQTAQLRKKTGIAHLRPHAFRHLAVTELLESGAPEQTVIALAGWIGKRMIDTYSHTRIEAKADAVKLLGPNERKTPSPKETAPPPAQAALSLDPMHPGRNRAPGRPAN